MAPKFFGFHDLTVDEKGRVSIPSAWRREIPAGGDDRQRVILKRNAAGNAELIPLETYIGLAGAVQYSLENTPEESERLRRMYSEVWDIEVDKAGRIVLPERVRQIFNLTGEVTLAGKGSVMEFWKRQQWNSKVDDGSNG